MKCLDKIEQDVTSLSPEDLARFRDWFAAYDAKGFDEGIKSDALRGRLDGRPCRRDCSGIPVWLDQAAVSQFRHSWEAALARTVKPLMDIAIASERYDSLKPCRNRDTSSNFLKGYSL